MVLSRLTKITGPGVATDTNWVGNNADFTGITTSATSFNIGVTTIHSTLIEAHNIKSTGIITATGGSFSGNVTAVDGTFSGNVSIAGTLTYEDVTNIDSVGIITAPALDVDDFLDVGSSIKLGNAGVITATSFVGSGAALTGIDATAIKDSGGNVKIQAQASGAIHSGVSTFQDIDVDGHTNLDNVSVAGVVTATSFSGSGANLTSLPAQATIANNADNRVITGGSGVNLNGEANFTFSGNTATITASSGYALVANGASTGIGLGSNGAIVFGNQNVAAYATGVIDASELKLNISGSNRINLKSSVLLIGNTSSQEVYGTNAVQIQGTTAGASSLSLLRHGNSPYLTLGSSGGSSLNAVTALSNNNRIGQINFAGADGTDINTHAASIAAYVDGSVSSNNVPARIVFATGPSETERLRIKSDGGVIIGGSSDAGYTNYADNLTIHGTSNEGITIRSGNASQGAIYFADTTGDVTGAYEGYLIYDHNGNHLRFGTDHQERLRITSTGKVKITSTTNNQRGLSVIAPKTQINFGTAEDVGGFLLSENNGQFGLSGGGYWTGSNWVATHTGSAQIRHDGSGDMVFCTNTSLTSGNNFTPTERLRITSSGQMGLGVSSLQANAKLQVNGNVGAAQFYTTTTSAPQTDFNSDVATNKAGLLLRRSSETNGDYSGLEFHNHPSSNTAYRKGGIYFQSDGSGFGRGDMVFVNDGAGDSANLAISDEKMRIHKEGYVTKPSQPRALVKIYSTTTMGNGKVTNWASPIYNVGSLWDTSNKRFVAPIDGLYLIGGNFRIGAPGKVRVTRFEIRAYNTSNGHMATYGGGVGGGNNYDGGSGGYDHPYVGFTNAIYLTTGQYLELWLGEVATEHTSYIQVSNEQSHMWCVLLQ